MSEQTVSRRGFLRTGLAGGAGAVLVWPALCGANGAAGAAEGVCVTLCNHWSYTGIGWQLGIESDVLSVTDAMEMADRPPHVKTCINLDARAYELMAGQFPEVAAKLRKYLAAGKVELIGGTYGQPMGTTFSGESNIRQIVVGREAIRKALGYEMVTFLEEEEFTHPQVPQIVLGAGFRYASLAQVDTWGRAGCPLIEANAILWKGIDGTTVPTIPKNSLFGYAPSLKRLAASPGYKKLRALGKPLIFTWGEFGWESPEHPDYLTTPAKYRELAEKMPVEFVTCKEYLDKYGAHPKETVYLPMDAWRKSLTWGVGGDQLRILERKVEAVLLAAERFDSVATALGGPPRPPPWSRPGKTCWPPRATTWDCASTRAGKGTGWRRWSASRTITTSPGARSATIFSTPPRNAAGRRWTPRSRTSPAGSTRSNSDRPPPVGRVFQLVPRRTGPRRTGRVGKLVLRAPALSPFSIPAAMGGAAWWRRGESIRSRRRRRA